MKTNNILTILLYALLATLVIAAVYKCNELRKEKLADQQDKIAFEKQMSDYSAAQDSAGSSFSAARADSSSATRTTVSRDGIEDDGTSGTASKTVTPSAQTKPAAKPSTASKTSKPKSLAAKSSSGRYMVRAGAFKYMDNARTRLEEVIKLGFQSAEIVRMPTQKGVLAFVVAKRTNNKSEAQRVMDLLEDKGIDADVVDSSKK